MSRLQLDRRAVACAITFGLVTTYMFLPLGFGRVFLYNTLYRNIKEAGLDVSQVSATQAMGIPALGMVAGLLIAVFVTYRKPRVYQVDAGSGVGSGEEDSGPVEIDRHKVAIALVAVVACFAVQAFLTWTKSEADPLLVGALTGLLLFMATRVVTIAEADDVFTGGMRMMALIGLIMITAQGFAKVLKETKQIEPLVKSATSLFAGSKPAAAFVHPYTDLREALTRYAAGHLARGIKNGTIKPLGEMLTEKSFINALIGLMATGGSTNHTMHLVAMARAVRRVLADAGVTLAPFA